MYSHVACDVMKERNSLSAKAEFIDMALNAISFLVTYRCSSLFSVYKLFLKQGDVRMCEYEFVVGWLLA